MASEAQHSTISPMDLFKAAEAVVRSGRRQTVRFQGKTIVINLQEPSHKSKGSLRRGQHGENAFLAASGTLPPLVPPRDISEMTEIAAEEAAQAAARAGLEPEG